MTEEPLVFKHVRGGKPFAPSEIPKLPPAAMKAVLQRLRENSDTPLSELSVDVAIDVVTIALRRLDPNVTASDIGNDEDFDMVRRAYEHIERANPSIFPGSPPNPSAPESPKDGPPA